MRVNFPDDLTEPISEEDAYDVMDGVNTYYTANSYDLTSHSHGNGHAPDHVATDKERIMPPIPACCWPMPRATAAGAGYVTNRRTMIRDIVAFTSVPGYSFGGLAPRRRQRGLAPEHGRGQSDGARAGAQLRAVARQLLEHADELQHGRAGHEPRIRKHLRHNGVGRRGVLQHDPQKHPRLAEGRCDPEHHQQRRLPDLSVRRAGVKTGRGPDVRRRLETGFAPLLLAGIPAIVSREPVAAKRPVARLDAVGREQRRGAIDRHHAGLARRQRHRQPQRCRGGDRPHLQRQRSRHPHHAAAARGQRHGPVHRLPGESRGFHQQPATGGKRTSGRDDVCAGDGGTFPRHGVRP